MMLTSERNGLLLVLLLMSWFVFKPMDKKENLYVELPLGAVGHNPRKAFLSHFFRSLQWHFPSPQQSVQVKSDLCSWSLVLPALKAGSYVAIFEITLKPGSQLVHQSRVHTERKQTADPQLYRRHTESLSWCTVEGTFHFTQERLHPSWVILDKILIMSQSPRDENIWGFEVKWPSLVKMIGL